MCATGIGPEASPVDTARQSPIDLPAATAENLAALETSYAFDPVNPWYLVRDTGHAFEIVYDPSQYVPDPSNPGNIAASVPSLARYTPHPQLTQGITWNGTFYKLVSLHAHYPSEHTVGGVRYAAEVHLVHQDAEGNNKLVVGVFLTDTGDDQIEGTYEIFKGMDQWVRPHGWEKGWAIVPLMIPQGNAQQRYHTYEGSLTTPPCTEGIRWIVFTQPVRVQPYVVAAIAARNGDIVSSARPTQELNGRSVD